LDKTKASKSNKGVRISDEESKSGELFKKTKTNLPVQQPKIRFYDNERLKVGDLLKLNYFYQKKLLGIF